MGRIKRLDDHLINRIAAGEVVERPASVLKELVENSLDSGARFIDIVVQSGGKRSIRIDDDGCGMEADDARLALERHATSKLRTPEDLDAIRTLGFRGEALPSIAAVSCFTLSTATEDGAGTEIRVEGGDIVETTEVGRPRGTTVRVERLFFNVPARRKFLKADATELSHIVRHVTRFALVNPTVRFRLASKNKTLLDAPAANDLLERIGQIYGEAFVEKLLPFEASATDRSIQGFAGRPAETLPRRDMQHVFVNGRAVQDRVLMHALRQAYGNTMPRDRHPAMFLFIDLDPALVDVNVHPQKSEVRFRDSGEMHRTVREAIGSALSQERAVPELSDLRPQAGLPEVGRGTGAAGAGPLAAHRSGVGEALAGYTARVPLDGSAMDRSAMDRSAMDRPPMGGAPARQAPGAPPGSELPWPTSPAPAPEMLREGSAKVIGQYLDAYIVAQDDRGLLVLDQHAAHERVLFEKFLDAADRGEVEIQRLAFPITLELTREETLLLEGEQEEFRRLGFLIEPFGATTWRIDGIPAVTGELDPGSLLRELIGDAAQVRSAASDVAVLRRRLVTNAACQAAIKINHRLTREGMQKLVDDLYGLRSPTTCPHGRPLIFRVAREQIMRAFDR
ncbi:hypothetical protein ABI59_03085 [Acidobacteria bacterium Mor1]|nr:hypothetical protein ABI59_03085 [Acidobacteria bacterium Mor1]